MRRILDPRSYLLCLACCLLFVGSCSEGEGGRCQIDSDCASGLFCSAEGGPGNGICRSVRKPAADASLQSSPDVGLGAGLDAGSDDGGVPTLDTAVEVFAADDAAPESD